MVTRPSLELIMFTTVFKPCCFHHWLWDSHDVPHNVHQAFCGVLTFTTVSSAHLEFAYTQWHCSVYYMNQWVHILYMDIIVSPQCLQYFSETSTVTILYRIRGARLLGCFLKSVHIPLSWLVLFTMTCLCWLFMKFDLSIYQTQLLVSCDPRPLFMPPSRGPRWLCVWYDLSSDQDAGSPKSLRQWWGRPCSGMRWGECWVEVLSGSKFLWLATVLWARAMES